MLDSRWFYKLRLRCRSLFLRHQVERELEEEFQYHLDQRTEQEISRGIAPQEARRTALRAMEGLAQQKEACRDLRSTNFLESLLQDLGYALRSLRRSPAFAAMAILTLALGMGASIAILTVVNAVLLRPLPFPDPGRLVALSATTATRNQDSTSFPDFLDWQSGSRSFQAMAAYRTDPFNITGDGVPEPVTGLRASHELLRVLGVSPAIGRDFDQKEQHLKSTVALLGYGLWLRRFGGDPGIVGQTIVLNEVAYTVIGVLPQGFRFPTFTSPDVLVPVAESADRSRGYLFAIARLAPGFQTAAAASELDALSLRLAERFPNSNRGRGVRVVPLAIATAGGVRTPLLILIGAALFVLLIGCANVGNLVLAKGIARGREIALRSALGAGASRLIRQLLTESVVLSLIAALPGSAMAYFGSKMLVVSLAQRFVLPSLSFDWRLLALTLLITLLCGVLCGLLPALMVPRWRLNSSLKEGDRGHAGGGRVEQRFQNLLVIAEAALTVVLLVGAGLLIRSFVLLSQTELGLKPDHVLMADLLLSKTHTEPQRREAFLREILESIGGLPGVEHVALHTDPPFLGGGSRETFHVEGRPDPGPQQGHPIAFNVVSRDFFPAMGIPIRQGRGFDQRDTAEGAPVAIVNEAMARRFWTAGNAIDHRIRLWYDRDSHHWFSVIGVAADVRYFGRDMEPVPQVFVSYEQNPYRSLPYPQAPFVSLVLRTAADPATMVHAMQTRIWAVDRNQPILHAETMEQALAQSLGNRRAYLVLLGCFAAIALLMATAGIYGLISYAVVRRTQEMGIRVALGATLGQIVSLVLRRAMILTSIGVALGIAGSLALTRVLSGVLFGITATDATTFAGVALLFALVAAIAAYIPARRAATIDPTAALRYE